LKMSWAKRRLVFGSPRVPSVWVRSCREIRPVFIYFLVMLNKFLLD
jgi:hypothetical protein